MYALSNHTELPWHASLLTNQSAPLHVVDDRVSVDLSVAITAMSLCALICTMVLCFWCLGECQKRIINTIIVPFQNVA